MNRVGNLGIFKSATAPLLPLAVCLAIIPFAAKAIVLGASSVQSYIGEPLKVEIPLKDYQGNVAMSAKSEDNALGVDVERRGSQNVLLVTSKERILEPYYSFSVNIGEQGDTRKKTYTVLLDLPAEEVNADTTIGTAPEASFKTETITAIPGSVMGPYEWAEAGNVPEKFGAVLDGQSIWRVARRINKALDVSVEQMAVALYEANPNAFFTKSIDSLKAGSFLAIPSKATAKRYSEKQAQARLDALSPSAANSNVSLSNTDPNIGSESTVTSSDSAISISSATSTNIAATDEPVTEERPETGVSEIENSAPFQINSAGQALASLDGSNADETNQQSVTVLAGTINTLVEELIKKDQRISYLENKVAAFEELQALQGEEQPPVQADQKQAESNSIADSQEVKLADSSSQTPSNFSEILATELKESSVEEQSSAWYLWLALGLIALLFIFRHILFEAWSAFTSRFSNDELPNFDDVPTQSYLEQGSVSETSVATEVGNVSFSSEQFVFNEDDELSESFIEIVESGSKEALDNQERDFSRLESLSSKGLDGSLGAHNSDLDFSNEDLIDDEHSAIEVKDYAEEEIDNMDIEDLFGLHLATLPQAQAAPLNGLQYSQR